METHFRGHPSQCTEFMSVSAVYVHFRCLSKDAELHLSFSAKTQSETVFFLAVYSVFKEAAELRIFGKYAE